MCELLFNNRIHTLCLLVVLFLGLGCTSGVPYENAAVKAGYLDLAKNFEQIRYILNYSLDNGDIFPDTLTALGSKSNQLGIPFEKEMFLCPGSGSKAGALTNIDEWTDFIYIGGIQEGTFHTAQIISPPENHGGRFGYVFFATGIVKKLTKDKIDALLRQPWAEIKFFSPNVLEDAKEKLSLNVPKRLQPFYPPEAFSRSYGTNSNKPAAAN